MVLQKGPWERREEWLNQQLDTAWQDRGAFPGLGPALEALDMRLGTALALELIASKMIASDADPWPIMDAILRGEAKPPQPAYVDDLAAVRDTWIHLPEERRSLLKLLSRFALTACAGQTMFQSTRTDAGDHSPRHRRRDSGKPVPYQRGGSRRPE